MTETAINHELIKKIDNLRGYTTEELLLSLIALDKIMKQRRSFAQSYSIAPEEAQKVILENIEYLDNHIKMMFSI